MEKNIVAEIFGSNLLNLVEDLFVVFDSHYKVMDISPSCFNILGLKADEIIGKNAADFIHPMDRVKISKDSSEFILETNTVAEETLRVKCANGTFKFIRMRSTHHPSIDQYYIAIGKDVHEEYLQIYLMKNAESYAQLGSWQFDVISGKRIWSKSVYDIFEIPYDMEISDTLAAQIYTPEGTTKIAKILQEAITNQTPWDFEQLMITYSGKEKWIRSKGSPACEDGKVLFLEGIIQDIHSKKKEEIALQEAIAEHNKVQHGIDNHFIVTKITGEGIFISVNQNFELLTGYHREEIIGKHVSLLKSDKMDSSFDTELFQEVIKNKKWRGEICQKKKNGEYYWLDMTITPVQDLNARELKEFIIISYDITEKKAGEEKLKLLIERLEYVLKGIDAGVWDWVDVTQKFVYWSPKTYELFGYQLGEISPSKEFVEREVHPDDLHLLRQMFYDIIKKKMTPYRGELRLRVKSGEYRWFQTHTFLVTDKNNNAKRLLGSLIDIHEIKKMESNLVEETKKTIQSSKLASIGEIAAGVAHEVNNPLTIIFGFIRMIEEELNSEKMNHVTVVQALDTIKQAASRAAKIITGLRDFSRDGAHDPFEEVRVTEVLDMALTLCRERFKINEVELKLDLRTQKFITCRRVELSQVFLNLIMNAFDAVKDSESPWIQVTTQEVPDYIEVSVTDSGQSISQETIDKMFQPFYTTKRFGSGTGLGLSIAKNIMANHRGEIFYDPSSKNTRFTVRLPRDFNI